MIQDYQTLNSIISESRIVLNAGAQIQKIFSTSRYIAISIRTKGKTQWLYLGRGAGHEGIWLGEKPPASVLRRRDQLLEYLRKHVASATFLNLELDPLDRVIYLRFGKWSKENTFAYFYKGREAYFAHYYYDETQWKLYTSAHGHLDADKTLESYFDDIGRSDVGKENQPKKIKTIEELLDEEESLLEKDSTKDKKFIKRKLANIKQDLEKIEQWPKLQKYAQEIQQRAFEEAQSFDELKGKMKILQHKFNFIGSKHIHEKLNLIYDKIKKLKKAEDLVRERLELTSKKQEKAMVENNLKVIQPIWQQSKQSSKIKKEKVSEFKLLDFSDFVVAIGRSAQENDQIRRDWAKKNDWWFHIEHVPSAHLYIKKKQDFTWDPQKLTLLGSCLRDHSKYTATEVPLLYTEVKNLKGVKGKAGAVIFKNEKRLNIIYDQNWKQHAKN